MGTEVLFGVGGSYSNNTAGGYRTKILLNKWFCFDVSISLRLRGLERVEYRCDDCEASRSEYARNRAWQSPSVCGNVEGFLYKIELLLVCRFVTFAVEKMSILPFFIAHPN